MARYIVENIVASGLAKKCEIKLAYRADIKNRIFVELNTFETGKISEKIIVKGVEKAFGLASCGMIKQLHLNKPYFSDTTVCGHFGNNKYAWEQVDRKDKSVTGMATLFRTIIIRCQSGRVILKWTPKISGFEKGPFL